MAHKTGVCLTTKEIHSNDAQDLNLQANTSGAEFESECICNALDFLSNGFKLVGTNAGARN